MKLYLDESGDLGWVFDRPNRNGGSSRYITMSGVLISDEDHKYVTRFLSDIYKKYNLTPGIEKKGANFVSEHARFITSQLNRIIKKSKSFRIISITVYKPNVFDALRRDNNIFYNYVLGLLLRSHVINYDSIEIFIDKRTIKVSHGESFPDYIKTQVWGDGHNVNIDCSFVDSSKNKMIWFADWYSNFVWRYYENEDSSSYEFLNSHPANTIFLEKRLFFPKN
ncbi:DUF3800 domain-containing protein [Seonamhaeicola sp.]|uniref:DUF3800 domain-containing protein n=1 Tax=Seonamhaeicola sp. TaxID=1912245 RepID=UPI002604B0DE|nr:DUF3800 domain-containing protein [Seonamhaeicola sp.]